MSLGLNAGESYVINNVAPGETPAVNVITNPHALVVNNAPGKVVLMGAEAGEWTVSVELADGSNVKYDVTVKSVANINDINHPGTSPGPITGTGASTGIAAPVEAKMDAGTGPVASSSTSASSSSSTPGTFTTTTETVAAAAPSAPAPASEPAAPAVVTAPAPISHSAFDFAPSVPAASYAPAPSSQMAYLGKSDFQCHISP